MKLDLKATTVFQKNYQATSRIVVNQGGTGSSKTYSLAQLFILKAFEVTGCTFSVVRKHMPTLRPTAMRDFIDILDKLGLYSEADHEKSNSTYNLNGNKIEFFGLDEPQKARSRRRDYLWLNEANELSLESFRQLNMRTNKQVFMDFNPSDEFHWIYDHVLTREDTELIISTYKDNPFLPQEVVVEIERYKEIDENYWNIYGLGQRGVSSTRIYSNFELINELPTRGEFIYGLDFGFNNPSALVELCVLDDDLYIREVIHQNRLTTPELITLMGDCGISKRNYIYADSEDPDAIQQLITAGFNAKPAQKGKGSVKSGIDMIKSRKLYVTKDSTKLLKELRSYSWKTRGEHVLDEPVKLNDHGADATRYAVYTHLRDPSAEFSFV